MKRLILILTMVLMGGLAQEVSAQKKGREVVCFQSNMHCGDCEKSLFEHLRFEKGVKDLKVDHLSNTVWIEFESKKNNARALAGSIEKKGYKAEKITEEVYNRLTGKEKPAK